MSHQKSYEQKFDELRKDGKIKEDRGEIWAQIEQLIYKRRKRQYSIST